MPMYEYKCSDGHKFVRFMKISDYKPGATCDCGKEGTRVLSAPMVRGDLPGYECPITGGWIEGRRAHEENLRKHGCRVLEDGEREAAIKRRQAEESAFDAKIESTAAEFVETLPTRKREQLAAEISNGVDATVVRQ